MVSHSVAPLELNPRLMPAAFCSPHHLQQQQHINPFVMWSMELKAAQEAFLAMLQQIQQPETRKAFLLWLESTVIRTGGGEAMCMNGLVNGSDSSVSPLATSAACATSAAGVGAPAAVEASLRPAANGGSPIGTVNGAIGCLNNNGLVASNGSVDYVADCKLRRIADDLRELMPLNAILPTEQITFPNIGENADCDPAHTLHVDAFLYDEDLVDELCDTGELGRNYCLDCSSHNTQPITYISHSASRERLAYMFRALLPPVPEDAVILDVGSRLGAVLYGANVYTKCRRIIGVELNDDLCQVQRNMITKYGFQDRVSIVTGDVQQHSALVNSADVLILNNVFEFFMTTEQHIGAWRYMRSTVKRGALLVTIPALQDSLQHLEVGFRMQDWVRELPPHDPNVTAPFDFQTETAEVKLYQVL